MIETPPEPHIDEVDGVADDDAALFDAVLQPHRSLSPQGFIVLMVVVGLVGFVSGMVFVMAGAWPVLGFFLLDFVLIYLAFRLNYRSARAYETVRLTEDTLMVERVSPGGKVQKWRFQPYWLRVDMEDPPHHDSALVLSSHGRSLVIGDFLTPEERLELADALRTALLKLREPPGQPAD